MDYPTAEGVAECITDRRYKEAVTALKGLITIAEIEMSNSEAFIKWKRVLAQWLRKRIHPPFSKYVVRVVDEIGTREKQPHGRQLKPNELNQNAQYYSCLYTAFGLVGDIDGQLQAWYNMNMNALEPNPHDWCELAEELEKHKRYSNAAMCVGRAIEILERSLQHRLQHGERIPMLQGLHSCWSNRRRLLERCQDAEGKEEANSAIEDVEDRIRQEQQLQQTIQMHQHQQQYLYPMSTGGGFNNFNSMNHQHQHQMVPNTPHSVQY